MKLCPTDKTIKEFSKFLPAEVAYQKEAQNENLYEYYDEEEESSEEEEKEEEEEKKNEQEAVAAIEEKKEGEKKEEDGESSGYGSEYYDEEGNFVWGKEGECWDWYYREDKEAYEKGERSLHHPGVMNPPMRKPMIEDGNES